MAPAYLFFSTQQKTTKVGCESFGLVRRKWLQFQNFQTLL